MSRIRKSIGKEISGCLELKGTRRELNRRVPLAGDAKVLNP